MKNATFRFLISVNDSNVNVTFCRKLSDVEWLLLKKLLFEAKLSCLQKQSDIVNSERDYSYKNKTPIHLTSGITFYALKRATQL